MYNVGILYIVDEMDRGHRMVDMVAWIVKIDPVDVIECPLIVLDEVIGLVEG